MKRSIFRMTIFLLIAVALVMGCAFTVTLALGKNAPIQIVWWGFTINIFFYAAVLWLICVAVIVLLSNLKSKHKDRQRA